jgi:hypothetical protein
VAGDLSIRWCLRVKGRNDSGREYRCTAQKATTRGRGEAAIAAELGVIASTGFTALIARVYCDVEMQALGATDKKASGENQRPTQQNLDCSHDRGRFHVAMPYPGDDCKLCKHDTERDYESCVEARDEKRKRVALKAHLPTRESGRPKPCRFDSAHVRLTSLMICIHVLEILLWASFYRWKGVASWESAFYFSAGSYSTVGAGEVTLQEA